MHLPDFQRVSLIFFFYISREVHTIYNKKHTEILFYGAILMYPDHQFPAGRHSAYALGATNLTCLFPRMMLVVNLSYLE